MSDERSLHNDIHRENIANEWLNNQIYKEAWLAYRAELVAAFERTKFNEKDLRDEIWRKMQTCNEIELHIKRVVQGGKVAKDKLSFIQRARKVAGL